LTQDFFVPLTNIHSSWQKDKMSSADAKAEILRSRAVGSEKMIRVIEFHEKALKDIETKNTSNHVLAKLKGKEKNSPTCYRRFVGQAVLGRLHEPLVPVLGLAVAR